MNENIDEELEKLRERRVLKPDAAKKILVVAIIVFIILCVIFLWKFSSSHAISFWMKP